MLPRGPRSRPFPTAEPFRGSAPLALLTHTHPDLDGGASEAELLTQAALDEAPVAGVQEAGGEDDDPGRGHLDLSGEEDAGLLAAAHRVQ